EALGNILRVSGRSQNAQQVLTAGLALAESSGDPQTQATFHLGLGNTARSLLLQSPVFNRRQQQLQEEEISTHYDRAATLATSRETRIQARLDRFSFLVSRNRLEEARTEARSLVSEVATLPPDRMGIYAQLHLAQNWLDLNQKAQDNTLPPELDDLLGTAIERSQALGDSRTQAHAYGLRGRLYEQATSISDNFQQAAALTQEALRLAPTYEAPDIAYLMFWQLGRIQSAKGQREEAIARYDQAVEILESLRADLVASGSEAQFSFRESIEPVYRELAGLLLQPAKSGEEMPPEILQANLRRVRQLIESLQLAELDNFFQDACLDAQPTEIEALDPNAAILYTAILPDRTAGTESLEVITAIPGQPLYHHTTPLQVDEVSDTVLRLRGNITNIRRPFSPEPAEKLYDWLIRPVRDRLQASGVQTLVFILDSELRSLPVAALYDGEQYLVQNYTLALTPGLQLLDPQPLAREQLTILSAGLTEARQGFAPLPFVGLELESIQQKAPAEVLLNDAFTKDNFKTTFADVDAPIIHIATHGEFSSNAEDTFILTWDDRINAKDLGSLLQGEPGDRQAIELLVLSACRTAVGDRRAALGLAGVAVRAGARSTMASLWYVDDEATARLMTRFYQELTTTNATKSEALRAAQVATLTQEEFARPLYWAAFVLVGNWL
ncbi:MAG: CHAT domain-containing protein, partial [Coleofasciculaceae cyanobacterium SM2_3_26]|nr:CHAT domain-containing protein [Coleofasciculaceae cyanobacterium SM2_3_26]